MPTRDLPMPANALCGACGSTGLVQMTLTEMLAQAGRGRPLDGGRRPCSVCRGRTRWSCGCECWHADEATPGDCKALTWRPCALDCPVYRIALAESRLAGNPVEFRREA